MRVTVIKLELDPHQQKLNYGTAVETKSKLQCTEEEKNCNHHCMTGHLSVVTLLSETKCTQHMPWMSWVKSKPTHARNLTFYFRILWLNMGTSCHQSLPNVNKFLNSTVCGSQSQRTRFCIKSVACYFLNRVLYSNLVCKKKFWLWNTI